MIGPHSMHLVGASASAGKFPRKLPVTAIRIEMGRLSFRSKAHGPAHGRPRRARALFGWFDCKVGTVGNGELRRDAELGWAHAQ